MVFKELEIQGFKSFPDKVKITFDEGVTGVVGPQRFRQVEPVGRGAVGAGRDQRPPTACCREDGGRHLRRHPPPGEPWALHRCA